MSGLSNSAVNKDNLAVELLESEVPIPSMRKNFELPPELVGAIFVIACRFPFKSHEGDTSVTPFTLAGVCGQWRAIVWSTPQVWSYISLCLGSSSRYDNQISLLEGWLLRSGNCPLALHLRFHNEQDWVYRLPTKLVQIIASLAPRWHFIDWVLPQSWYPILEETKHFPLLNSVSTVATWSDILAHETQMPFNLFKLVPTLQEIGLNGFNLLNVEVPWEQLTRVTLQNVYLNECFYALSKAVHVECCEISTVMSNARTGDIHETSLELLSLVQFSVSGVTWDDTVQLLSYMFVPLLQAIEFSSPQDRYVPRLQPFLPILGCHLTRLKLTDFAYGQDESEIFELVSDISSLEDVDIEILTPTLTISDLVVDLLRIHSLVSDEAGVTETFFLPALQRFNYSGPMKTNAGFDQSLLDVLRLRRDSNAVKIERTCHSLLVFGLKGKDESPHVMLPSLMEGFRALANDGLDLTIVIDGKSWL